MKGILMLLVIAFWLFVITMGVVGIIVNFSASVILGIIGLILSPMNPVIGIVYTFVNPNISEEIARWAHLI